MSWRRSTVAVMMGLVLLALPVGCSQQAAPPPTPAPQANAPAPTAEPTVEPVRTTGSAVGQEAPDFSLVDLDGQKVDLTDYRGQLVLLNFWATWCGPCRMEVPGLVAVQQQYQDRGFTVVAVNMGESESQVEAFAKNYGMDFPVLLDPSGQAANLYPSRGIPTSFVLDRDGVVRQVVVGAMDEAMLSRLIESFL